MSDTPPAGRPITPPPGHQDQLTDPSIAARTTFQEDLTTAGQRRVNLIWEFTQAIIAVAVVTMTMVSSLLAMLYKLEIPNILAVAFGLITGFYFARTNHEKIGGIGPKPSSPTATGR